MLAINVLSANPAAGQRDNQDQLESAPPSELSLTSIKPRTSTRSCGEPSPTCIAQTPVAVAEGGRRWYTSGPLRWIAKAKQDSDRVPRTGRSEIIPHNAAGSALWHHRAEVLRWFCHNTSKPQAEDSSRSSRRTRSPGTVERRSTVATSRSVGTCCPPPRHQSLTPHHGAHGAGGSPAAAGARWRRSRRAAALADRHHGLAVKQLVRPICARPPDGMCLLPGMNTQDPRIDSRTSIHVHLAAAQELARSAASDGARVEVALRSRSPTAPQPGRAASITSSGDNVQDDPPPPSRSRPLSQKRSGDGRRSCAVHVAPAYASASTTRTVRAVRGRRALGGEARGTAGLSRRSAPCSRGRGVAVPAVSSDK